MLQLKGITKTFAGVTALDQVNLDLAAGEVVAIIGENGAGKSTLMKVLSGVHQPDSGSISLDGQVFVLRSPREALDRGIRIIYQELSVLENLSIGANIFLGNEFRRGPMVDESRIQSESEVILKRIGLSIDPRTLLGKLSIAERQLVEIGRALSLNVRVLILDEPTSSLTLEETQRLLKIVLELKQQGVAILYITHRLDEVSQVADRVVGLRDGKNAGELDREEISKPAMVKMMVGRDIERPAYTPPTNTQELLELRNFTTQRYANHKVNLTIRGGEILGMAGLVGAGRTELARAVYGIDPHQGSIHLEGEEVTIGSPRAAIGKGIVLAPEDRRGCGLTVQLSVEQNASLPRLKELAGIGGVRIKDERSYANEIITQMNVKTSSNSNPISSLSGGNQQKVVLGRWLKMDPKVFIVDEPTRGIDVGSKAEIYEQLKKIAADGTAVWMISSDMEEILSVSDRIAVMHEGRITGVVTRQEATEEMIMKLAVGGTL